MEIRGKVYCFFEQSGTFKNEFIKLGINAEDYDIKNDFGQTDYIEDLFKAINDAYDDKPSVFDKITSNDLIFAFFPCIYFCQMSQYAHSLNYTNYRSLEQWEACDKIIERQKRRNEYLITLTKMVRVCLKRKFRLIFENPITGSFLNNYFIKPPSIRDNNRMLRGDYFVKPTGYWFFNCEPTNLFTYQFDKKQKKHQLAKSRGTWQNGICNKERSMISADYARNFICDCILGLPQENSQLSIFNSNDYPEQ